MWLDCSNKECTINLDFVVSVYIDGNVIIAELHDGQKIEVGIYPDFEAAENRFKMWKVAIRDQHSFFRF